MDFDAERRQRPLGMVPGLRRLDHLRRTVGVQAGQQNGALHLGAGDGRLVRLAAQRRPADTQRRPAGGGGDPCAHALQGVDDAPHRPAAQRGVTGDCACERMACQDTRQQAHGGSGVAGVQRRCRGPQAAEAPSRDGDRRAAVARATRFHPHLDTERLQAPQGGCAVGAGRIVAYGGRSVGQRRQQGVAVRYGLVTGNPQLAADRTAGADRHGRRSRWTHAGTIQDGIGRVGRTAGSPW